MAPLSRASVNISLSWEALVALASHETSAIQGVVADDQESKELQVIEINKPSELIVCVYKEVDAYLYRWIGFLLKNVPVHPKTIRAVKVSPGRKCSKNTGTRKTKYVLC